GIAARAARRLSPARFSHRSALTELLAHPPHRRRPPGSVEQRLGRLIGAQHQTHRAGGRGQPVGLLAGGWTIMLRPYLERAVGPVDEASGAVADGVAAERV